MGLAWWLSPGGPLPVLQGDWLYFFYPLPVLQGYWLYFIFKWDSGDEACLARLECYGHAPPDPHSGLPQIDLSAHSDVLILAEDLQRQVLVVPFNPTPNDEAHRRTLM